MPTKPDEDWEAPEDNSLPPIKERMQPPADILRNERKLLQWKAWRARVESEWDEWMEEYRRKEVL